MQKQVSKCDLCGHDCYGYPDDPLKAKPKNGMVRKIICDKCAVEWLMSCLFEKQVTPAELDKGKKR